MRFLETTRTVLTTAFSTSAEYKLIMCPVKKSGLKYLSLHSVSLCPSQKPEKQD
jgi:hypothetical protein